MKKHGKLIAVVSVVCRVQTRAFGFIVLIYASIDEKLKEFFCVSCFVWFLCIIMPAAIHATSVLSFCWHGRGRHELGEKKLDRRRWSEAGMQALPIWFLGSCGSRSTQMDWTQFSLTGFGVYTVYQTNVIRGSGKLFLPLQLMVLLCLEFSNNGKKLSLVRF